MRGETCCPSRSGPCLKLCRRRPEALIDGIKVPLTWRQWQLLGFLCDRPGETVSNAQLCDLFDLHEEHVACNAHILRIVYLTRQTLRAAGWPDLIETVLDRGYRLVIQRTERT